MAPAYLRSETADYDLLQAEKISAAAGKWSSVADYLLDRGGPLFRPYRRMGAEFANVAALNHLRTVAGQNPDKLAISDGVNRLTYSELLQAVEALARHIAAVVPEGTAIGILLANSAWYAVSIMASMAAGRPCVPLNARDPLSRIIEIATDAQLSAIIGTEIAAEDGSRQPFQWIDPARFVAGDRQTGSHPLPPSASLDAPAIVLYTSGSTGRPKGVVISQRSLLLRVQQYVDACHISSEDVFLPLTGPATIAGCREVLAALLSGGALHLLEIESVGLRAVRSRMQSEGVTITYLVPALLRALMADGSADAFKSLRVVRIGGEKVSPTDTALLRKAVSSACLIQIGYSSTETTGTQWFLPPDWREETASVPVGWLLPGLSYAIVDDEGLPVQPGETGELLIRSPYVLLGYWENGAVVPADADPDDPGIRIFPTGDLVQMDEEGLLRVVGRKGRQLKINGRRVEPAELERVLRAAPAVTDAEAIVTESNELVAFAVIDPTAEPVLPDDLRQLAGSMLPSPLRPLRVHLIAEIPRLPSGKVDGVTLAAMDRAASDLSAKMATPALAPPVAGNKSKIHAVVQDAWNKILGSRVNAGSWEDAGGDSLQLLHCVMEIESSLGKEIALDAFTIAMSMQEMVDAIVSAQAGGPPAGAQEEAPPLLFLLPGSVGYGPSMAAFATAMGKVAKVAPVRYPALDLMLSGQSSMSDMAEVAVQQIGKAQPSGPVRLLGHSLGGAVAYEVAALLLASGRTVKFLGILDTSIEGERSAYRDTFTRTISRIWNNRVTASRMACRALAKVTVAMGFESRLARIMDQYAKGKFNATCFRIKLELQEVLRAKAFFAWLEAPKPALPIAGTLFRCERPGMSKELGWKTAFESLDVVPIAGGHLDLVVEPHLATNRPFIERAVVQTYGNPLAIKA